MIDLKWRYKTLNDVTIINHSEVRRVESMDFARHSTQSKLKSAVDSYCKKNAEQYFVSMNTWLWLAEDIGNSGCASYLHIMIKESGLIDTIAHCSGYALLLIQGKPIPPKYAYIHAAFGSVALADSLQILRYLKRFTPNGLDGNDKDRLNAFYETNRGEHDSSYIYERNGVLSRTPYLGMVKGGNTADAQPSCVRTYNTYLTRKVRSVVRRMLKGYKTPREDAGSYTNGASQDVCTCTFCKRFNESLLKERNPLVDFDYQSVDVGRVPTAKWVELLKAAGKGRWQLVHNGFTIYAVNPTLVPKDYKGPRIIAPERFDRQYRMKAIAAELERCLVRNGFGTCIPLHDQTVNQKLAFIGAAKGTVATVDLSSASDTVTKQLVGETFPANIYEDMIKVMPTHVIRGDAYLPLRAFGTMGSALTFIVESIIFFAIAVVAVELYIEFTGDKPAFIVATAYGDDITISAEAAETLYDILKALGFKVNTDKSYHSGPYRESCGKEYYLTDHGVIDLTTLYWPRKDMTRDTTTWNGLSEEYESLDSSWLALSNRLYTVLRARSNDCTAHTFMRLYLTQKAKVTFVPPQYASEGDLIGDSVEHRFMDLLTRKTFRATWDEYELHPSWRFEKTTATKVSYRAVKPKGMCPCTQLTVQQLNLVEEHLAYEHWLKYGPTYDDPLMELLHIPSSRRTFLDDISNKQLTFSTRFSG